MAKKKVVAKKSKTKTKGATIVLHPNKESKPPGRPTDYRPEYAQILIDYFSVEPYREIMRQTITKSGDVIEVPVNEANDFPTLAGFAIKIGVCRDTLLEWSKVHPEFSGAYKRCKDYQENFLAINGNKGLINQPFGIFTAKNVIGWRDKVDHTVEETPASPDALLKKLSSLKLSKEDLLAAIDDQQEKE